MEWVSVDKELPTRLLRVIIYDHDGFGVLCGRHCKAGWILDTGVNPHANITHWMPLPDNPAFRETINDVSEDEIIKENNDEKYN